MSEESVTTSATPAHGHTPGLNYINNAKIQVKFDGSCLKQDYEYFYHINVVNLFVYPWLIDLNTDFILKDFSFGAVKPIKISMNILMNILILDMILDSVHKRFFILFLM